VGVSKQIPNTREIGEFPPVKFPKRHQRTHITPKQRSCTTKPKKLHCFYKLFVEIKNKETTKQIFDVLATKAPFVST
jgi:hypothetical protein